MHLLSMVHFLPLEVFFFISFYINIFRPLNIFVCTLHCGRSAIFVLTLYSLFWKYLNIGNEKNIKCVTTNFYLQPSVIPSQSVEEEMAALWASQAHLYYLLLYYLALSFFLKMLTEGESRGMTSSVGCCSYWSFQMAQMDW